MSGEEIKNEAYSFIDIKHLLINSILFIGLAYVIMKYLMLFAIWAYIGDGAYPKNWDFYITLIYSFSAIALLFPFLIYRIILNYRKGHIAKMNDYIIVCAEIIITSICIYNLSYK